MPAASSRCTSISPALAAARVLAPAQDDAGLRPGRIDADRHRHETVARGASGKAPAPQASAPGCGFESRTIVRLALVDKAFRWSSVEAIGNAVANDFVKSLAKPGGNITGISSQSDDVLAKLIEILHAAVPGAKRFAVLLNGSNPLYPLFWDVAQHACAELGLVPTRITASAPAELDHAVEEMVRQRSQAVVVAADGVYSAARARLQELLQATRLPAAYGLREHAAIGGLLSYAPDLAGNFRYAAKFVDKILNGTPPADLPVEQPTKFTMVINLAAAKRIGLVIPQSLLIRADELIQ